MHPPGEHGWHYPVAQTSGGGEVAAHQHAAYRRMVRSTTSSATRRFRGIPHQQICGQWSKVEHRRIRYIRRNRDTLRADAYRQAQIPPNDAVRGVALGKRVIPPPPPTCVGGPREMEMSELYQDAMATVRSFGKPHLFISFTRNPSWPDVAPDLLPSHTAQTRQDIAARLCRLKLNAPMVDICARGDLGEVSASWRAIALQKRGVHRAHIIGILEDAPRPTGRYDDIVREVLPGQ